MQKAYEDKLEGKITEEFWAEQQRKWQERVSALEMELRRIEQENLVESLCCDVGEVLWLAAEAPNIFARADHFEKRKVLDTLLSNSILYNGKLEVIWREPFSYFVKYAPNKKWCAWGDSNARPSDPESDALST